ncbi:MAG: hypothetical protein ACRERX_21200 [Pseudomonas sp.]
MKIYAIIFICFLITGCDGPFSADESVARRQLLEIAPIGSDVRFAVIELEKRGFDCRWYQQQAFVGLSGKHNYLYCNEEKMVRPLISRRWQLALVHDNYIVTDAKFGISLTGL